MPLHSHLKPDQPLWNVWRILAGLRHWLWLTCIENLDVPFWDVLKYRHRPHAAHRAGKPWLG